MDIALENFATAGEQSYGIRIAILGGDVANIGLGAPYFIERVTFLELVK